MTITAGDIIYNNLSSGYKEHRIICIGKTGKREGRVLLKPAHLPGQFWVALASIIKAGWQVRVGDKQ